MFYRVKFIPALLLSAVLMGCTEKKFETEQNPVSVRFNVSPISYEVEPMTKGTVSGADLAGIVNTIGYKIFKVSTLVASDEVSFDPETEAAPDGFGTFEATILPGSYEIYFYAYGSGTGSVTISEQKSINQIYILGSDKDEFSKLFSYTITSSTGDIDVTLPRKSGKLTIKATDTAPSEVAKIVYSATDKCRPLDGVSNVPVYQNQWTASPTITNGVVSDYSRYIPNPQSKTDLKISIYDNSENLLREITAQVPVYSGRNTVVSGDLFSNLGEKALTIKVEDTWGEDYEYHLE